MDDGLFPEEAPGDEDGLLVLGLFRVRVVLDQHDNQPMEGDGMVGQEVVGVQPRVVRKLEKHSVDPVVLFVPGLLRERVAVHRHHEGQLYEVVEPEVPEVRHQGLRLGGAGVDHEGLIFQLHVLGHFPVLLDLW